MKMLKSLKRQAGMTLTESLLTLAIGSMVAVLAYGGYKTATASVAVSSQVQGTVQLVSAIKRVFGTGADFSSVTLANVVNSKIVPSDFKTTATPSIATAWNGTITPAVGNQAGATPTSNFKLTVAGVPADGCMDFAAGIASAAQTLWVGGTTAGTHDVKTATGAYDPGKAAAQCGDPAFTGTIILVAS